MKYSKLAAVYDHLEQTSKRLEKSAILSRLLKNTPTDDLEILVLLLQGRVFARHDERDLGLAAKSMEKAIALATGVNPQTVTKEWKKTGDLGDVAESLIRKKKQVTLGSTELTVKKVFGNLRKLAEEQGSGSNDRKMQAVAELLTSATPIEARYIARTILQDLRIGVGEGAMRDAIVWAFFPVIKGLFAELEEEERAAKSDTPITDISALDKVSTDSITAKEQVAREAYNHYSDAVQHAYNLSNDFGIVAKLAKTKGLRGLLASEMQFSRPIKVMLALKTDTISEAFEIVGTPAAIEYKFDGFRVEIHKKDGKVNIFTRRLDNITAQFPDIVAAVEAYIKADGIILDAEAVGFDPQTKKYLPFQNISQRIKRKYDIDSIAKLLPVEVNVFDILAYQGKSVLSEPFSKRRAVLEKLVPKVNRVITPSTNLITGNEREVMQFFMESKEKGNEGIMIKNLKAPYRPGARVGHMLKYKQTMENLDLVITGAEWGEGKRAKWLSSFDIACVSNGSVVNIGKAATGLKEKASEGLSFGELTDLLRPLIIDEKEKHVRVTSKIVIEVGYEEIQKSPSYNSGYALRFPRIVRLREDKGLDDVASLEHVERLFSGQRFSHG